MEITDEKIEAVAGLLDWWKLNNWTDSTPLCKRIRDILKPVPEEKPMDEQSEISPEMRKAIESQVTAIMYAATTIVTQQMYNASLMVTEEALNSEPPKPLPDKRQCFTCVDKQNQRTGVGVYVPGTRYCFNVMWLSEQSSAGVTASYSETSEAFEITDWLDD